MEATARTLWGRRERGAKDKRGKWKIGVELVKTLNDSK
jgi:hypothetical protein